MMNIYNGINNIHFFQHFSFVGTFKDEAEMKKSIWSETRDEMVLQPDDAIHSTTPTRQYIYRCTLFFPRLWGIEMSKKEKE